MSLLFIFIFNSLLFSCITDVLLKLEIEGDRKPGDCGCPETKMPP